MKMVIGSFSQKGGYWSFVRSKNKVKTDTFKYTFSKLQNLWNTTQQIGAIFNNDLYIFLT